MSRLVPACPDLSWLVSTCPSEKAGIGINLILIFFLAFITVFSIYTAFHTIHGLVTKYHEKSCDKIWHAKHRIIFDKLVL